MAPEVVSKKRKASAPSDEVAKAKKVKKDASEVLTQKRQASDSVKPAKVEMAKAPKQSTSEVPIPSSTQTANPSKKVPKAAAKAAVDILVNKPKSSKDVSAAKKSLKVANGGDLATAAPEIDAGEVDEDVSMDDDEDEIDDQTEALLKGFESEDEDSLDKNPSGVMKMPDFETDEQVKKNLKKATKAAKIKATKGGLSADEPGVVYLGRIPHGFYENQIREYFEQFGPISRARLSRNRKTGASKHFAFIEFKSAEVAEIVSKTMDNYLLFNHILKCKVVPKEQVHEKLFEGANKRFKKVPWNKMEGRKLKLGKPEAAWGKAVDNEKQRRIEKAEKLKKDMGYEFEIPELKSTKDIVKQIEEAPVDVVKAIETPESIAAETAVKANGEGRKKAKGKKNKGAVVEATVETPTTAETVQTESSTPADAFADIEATKEKKSKKKAKKSKAVV